MRFCRACADETTAAGSRRRTRRTTNAETLLLQLARGTGLRDSAASRRSRDGCCAPCWISPAPRSKAWLSEHEIPHVDDSSNASPDYARNRVRQGAMPALRSVNSAFARHTVQTAALLREDEAFLASLAQDFLQKQGRAPEVGALERWRARSARECFSCSRRRRWSSHIEALHDLCFGTEAAELSLPGGGASCGRAGDARFRRAGDEPWPETALARDDRGHGPDGAVITLSLPKRSVEVHNTLTSFCFKSAEIRGTLTVTSPKNGDRIRICRPGLHQKALRLFAEAGLAQRARRASRCCGTSWASRRCSASAWRSGFAPQPGDTAAAMRR